MTNEELEFHIDSNNTREECIKKIAEFLKKMCKLINIANEEIKKND